jgi:DNA-directed RNA polymerase subunit N (RpoN/RPB10)
MADIADFYEKEKSKIDEPIEVDEVYKNFEKIHTGHILDNLGLKRYCCRRNLISNIDMMDII